ncbi:MAG TPA: serine--tRNA ligase [Chloroflexia bacterium]|nr:serine--tRNA ligase [Chloroflexia bacterium]
MLDLRFIRENPDKVRWAIQVKRVDLDLDLLLAQDQKVLKLKREIQLLNEEKNSNSKRMGKATPEERPQIIARGKAIGEELKLLEPQLRDAEEELRQLLLLVPNVPAEDVPVGADDSENVEVKRWGEPPKFDFTPLDHVQILEKHNWAEFERAAKVSGSRSFILKNDMVVLEMALHRFVMDRLQGKQFTLLTVPSMARDFAFEGTGHFPTGRDQVYYMPADDLYLSGTAEVPVNALHSGEILSESDLPITYAAFSPCFRREAGSGGRDVRGLIRVHQFTKIEQYIMCRNDPAESARWHTTILGNAEEILQALEIPYRVVEVCTGDMGAGKIKMHDIESWVPSEQKYRETHSCSSLGDWQARRTNLRYRDSDGKVQFCYTLNNTALATPRFLVPFLENHQQADASIRIPEALRPYLGGREKIG